MRVLMAAPDMLWTRSSGLRTQVVRTAEELQKLGCGVTFFTGCETIDPGRFDLAHAFSMDLAMYCKSQALRRYGLPLVFSSVMWRSPRPAWVRISVELLRRSPKLLLNDVVACRKLSESAVRILPNTEAELRWLQSAIGVPADKCAVVPNGVDEHFPQRIDLCEAFRERLGFDQFVLSVAMLGRRKNLALLAEVTGELGYPLVLIGPNCDEPTVARLKRIARRTNLVRLVGQLDNRDPLLGAAYHACRVFALPSQYETPGIAALEAALTGARVVITQVGGTQEYFGDDALYVRPGSKSSLRQAVQSAWRLGRPEDGARIRSRLLGEFSWQSVAQKTLLEYRRALGEKQSLTPATHRSAA